MRKYKKKSHTPLNRTDVVTFRLTMIHNWYLTLMYLLISFSFTKCTKSKTTYIIVHLHFFFYTFFFNIHGFTNSFYTYKQSTTVSTAQYNDKGDKFFVTFN